MKHLWKLISRPSHSIWAEWVFQYRLNGKSMWRVSPPSDCAWYWRKLLSLRGEMRSHIEYRIGDGRNTYLWWDPWLECGPLLDIVPSRITMDTGLCTNARVSDIIQGGRWSWPASSSYLVRMVRARMPTYAPGCSMPDRVIWKLTTSGEYTVASFLHTQNVGHRVWWFKLVWFSQHVPRHSFVLWLVMRGALNTRDKLSRFMAVSPTCLLCGTGVESIAHLCMDCPYSKLVWSLVTRGARIRIPVMHWDYAVRWMVHHWKGKGQWSKTCKLLLGATIYQLWAERNTRLFDDKTRTPDETASRILADVRLCLVGRVLGSTLQDDALRHIWKV